MGLRLLPRLQAPPAWDAHTGVPLGCCGVRAATDQPSGQRAAGTTVPLTAEDSLFLQHHLTGIELQDRRRPSARLPPRQAASSQQRTGRSPSQTPPHLL